MDYIFPIILFSVVVFGALILKYLSDVDDAPPNITRTGRNLEDYLDGFYGQNK